MPQELDQDAVRLAKAIRYTESRDKEDAKGASGEFGLYQFMPATWAATTKKYGLDPNDVSRENQNKAAYSQIKELKDKGYKPSQIAAFWNSGKLEGWEELRGTNKAGVKFDVPEYVNKVGGVYEGLKTSETPKTVTTKSTVAEQKPAEAKKPLSNRIASFLGFEKTVDTLGNILARGKATEAEKAYIPKPTGKEIAGAALNVAATALPIGALEKTGAAAVGKFVAPKLAKFASKVGIGAATGASLDVAQDLEAGRKVDLGAGTAIGTGLPVVGGLVSRMHMKGTAGRVINSLIKPLTKNFSYGKNPGRAVSELGITANSLEDLERKIGSARKATGEAITNLATQVPANVRINAGTTLDSFSKAIEKAVANNDQALYNRLNEAKTAITNIMAVQEGKITPVGSRVLDNLSYKEALDVKRIIGDLTKWTGQKTEDETVNGALTRAYGALKEQMNKAAAKADPKIAAELRKMNERYADLTSAEVATRYRDVLQARQNLVNLPGKIGFAGSLLMAPFTGGVTPIVSAFASYGVDRLMSSPAFKTRLAKWLAGASQKDKDVLFKAYPNILRFFTEE